MVSSMGLLLVPVIAEDLRVSAAAAQWTLTVNLLVGAVATPLLGRLSDGPRKRGLLQATMLVVLAGSLVAALSPNLPLLLVGRALQGFAFGITAITVAIARERLAAVPAAGATATLSVSVATGLGAGYPITGVVAQYLDFRFAFWCAAVIVAASMLFVAVKVPSLGREPRRGRFDVGGALLFSTGMAALVTAVSQGPALGWASPAIVVLVLVTVAAFVGWVLLARRSPSPLFDLTLLRLSDVRVSHAASTSLGIIAYLAMSCLVIILLAPTDMGYGAGVPVVWAGVILAPVACGSLFVGWVMARWATPRLLFALLPAGACALILCVLTLLLAPQQPLALAASSVLLGLGMGAIAGAGPVLIAAQVPVSELGSTISFSQVLRMSGGAVGSAIAGAVFLAYQHPSGLPTAAGMELALWTAAVLAVALTGVLGVCLLHRER